VALQEIRLIWPPLMEVRGTETMVIRTILAGGREAFRLEVDIPVWLTWWCRFSYRGCSVSLPPLIKIRGAAGSRCCSAADRFS